MLESYGSEQRSLEFYGGNTNYLAQWNIKILIRRIKE